MLCESERVVAVRSFLQGYLLPDCFLQPPKVASWSIAWQRLSEAQSCFCLASDFEGTIVFETFGTQRTQRKPKREFYRMGLFASARSQSRKKEPLRPVEACPEHRGGINCAIARSHPEHRDPIIGARASGLVSLGQRGKWSYSWSHFFM